MLTLNKGAPRECGACGREIPTGGSLDCGFDHRIPDAEDLRDFEFSPREPRLEVPGPFALHDQRCAVLSGESAVYCLNDGVFHPSWKAQSSGWRLIRARNWFQRIVLQLLFGDRA